MHPLFADAITSEEQLQALLGTPSELARHKVITHLDAHCRDFIQKSPLLFIASSDAHGRGDVSPRGDAAGFVRVLDDQHLVIPERPGNKRGDTLRNVLQNPHVGLLLLIPGLGEVLRINGRARILKDAALLQELAAQGKVPALALGVAVEECFLQCAKAMRRSRLWDPSSWLPPPALPRPAAILADHARRPSLGEQQVAALLQESYEKRLY